MSFRLTWIVILVLTASEPAHGRSFLSSLGHSLGSRCHAVVEGLKDTALCVDFFAGSNLSETLDVHAGATLKVNLPSYNGWKKARAERKMPRLLYLSWGVSNSVAFTGYNPLFGGWNASYTVPLHSGFGGGLFAGGPYTGFYVNTPFLLSLGGWVDDNKARAAAPKQPPPDPFAAVTLTAPLLSRFGASCGVRLWIFSPTLEPLVRPFKRPAWWLHNRKKKVIRWARKRLGPAGRWTRKRLGPAGRWTKKRLGPAGRWTKDRLRSAGRWCSRRMECTAEKAKTLLDHATGHGPGTKVASQSDH